MPQAWQLLQAARLTKIMQALQDTRQLPEQLKFLARTPIVPAVDAEIMARFTGYVTIADLVADDQRAVTYQNSKLSYETVNIPNIKHGQALTQAMLNQLQSILNGNALPQDMGIFSGYENRVIDGLLLGVRQRMEALIIAMQLDSLTYDRLGIKITGATWGMPSDLKVTPATGWDTAGSATPVNDLWSVRRTARVRYVSDGIEAQRPGVDRIGHHSIEAGDESSQRLGAPLAPELPLA